MSREPRSAGEFFSILYDRFLQSEALSAPTKKRRQWLKQQIDEAKFQYPFLKGKTEFDYIEWRENVPSVQYPPPEAQPKIPSKDFWLAAYNYDPSEEGTGNDLVRIIHSGRAGPYDIGRVYGKHALRLIPSFTCLPTPLDPDFKTHLELAPTDATAIWYPDGHPSEETFTGLYNDSATGRQGFTIRAQDDDVLRRFTAIGWVQMQNSDGSWNCTGHVLVIDMDDRAVRHRQPWLVLASEWPADREQTSDDGFTFYAEKDVVRNNKWAAGVFPGDNNRTPICCIKPGPGAQEDDIVLRQLGRDFDFSPLRRGGLYRYRRSDKGPGLARIMDWYWDPKAKQEVCFFKEGVYLRYDRSTKQYSYPNFSQWRLDGAPGLFGVIDTTVSRQPESRFIPLHERTGPSQLLSAQQTHQRQMTHKTMKRTITASTPIQGGQVVSSLRLAYTDITLHEWFRIERQKRFDDRRQALVNVLVGLYRAHVGEVIKTRTRYTEAEILEMKSDSELRKGLQKIKEKAALERFENLPERLKSDDFRKLGVFGQAYEGQSLQLKAKCPACAAIYPFPEAAAVTQSQWRVIGELDPKKAGSVYCGCCAEAICFVEFLGDYNFEEDLYEDLGIW
ncbi:MAG: hypothetical protein Q9170_006581 [Blastenia crenularia]